jgi:DDE domain
MVCHLQVELSRRVRSDGGARCHGRTYHRFAMGPTLRPRLREKKAIGNNEALEKITLDGSRASHQAVAELKADGVLPAQTLVRASKYLNNLIEQDHRKAPQRCYPMLGFKTFGNAEVTLSGIELANKIKKGQFDTSEITSPRVMILHVWEAVLAA